MLLICSAIRWRIQVKYFQASARLFPRNNLRIVRDSFICSEEEGSSFLWNVGEFLPDYIQDHSIIQFNNRVTASQEI